MKTAERVRSPRSAPRRGTWSSCGARGTPAAGLALPDGWRRTGREPYLAAARRAGDFLVATPLARRLALELPAEGDATPWWFR